MKNKIIFILLCCVAIALFADDGVLLLFRNDGKIEAFETSKISKISYSENNNVVMQNIWTDAGQYQVPLSMIDSIRYTTHSAEAEKKSQDIVDDVIASLKTDTPDYDEIAKSLDEAAAMDNDVAQLYLGNCYEYGLGKDFSMETAKEYYDLSARQGNEAAAKKLDYIEQSTSSVELPEGTPLTPSEIVVYTSESAHVVNGDCSFKAEGGFATARNANHDLVYLSLRTNVDDSDDNTPLALNAKETAVSMLLFAYPFVFNFEEGDSYSLMREYIASLSETDALASAVERSIAQRGYLEVEDVRNELSAASLSVQRGLGADIESLGHTSARAYDPVQRNRQVRRAGAVGPSAPSIINEYSAIYDVRSQIEGTPKYTNAGWDINVKVSNYTPLYLSMVKGQWDGNKGQVVDDDEMLDYIVKPANTTDFIKAMGVKGFSDMVEKQTQFWNHVADINDLYNSDTSYDYFSAWKDSEPWNTQTKTVPMRLENHNDVMMVLSPKDNDIMYLYNIWEILCWPAINSAFKELLPSYQKTIKDKDGNDVEKTLEQRIMSAIFKMFVKKVNAQQILKMRNASKDGWYEVFSEMLDLAEDAALEFLKDGLDDFVEDFLKKASEGTLEMTTSGNWYQLLTKDEAFSKTLKVYKEIGKYGSLAGNCFMFADYISVLDTYSVRFNLDDASPVSVEVKTGNPSSVSTGMVIIPIEISTNAFITECGVVYTDGDDMPSVLDGDETATIDPCYSGQVPLTNLAINQKYRARAYAKIDQGYGDGQTMICYGDVVEFTTGSGTSRYGDIVDLGVSVYWADCNIGALSTDGVGCYVAWGEITTKTSFSLSNYALYDAGTWKYSPIDNKTRLLPEDDMAREIWEEGWRIPSREEFQELIDKCDWSDLTTSNGTPGRFVYNRSDHSKHIFLPAAGYFKDNQINYFGDTGYYWSNERSTDNFQNAYYLLMNSSNINPDLANKREYGRQLRPVKDKPFLVAEPDIVDFEDVEVGSSKKVTVLLRNTSSSYVVVNIPYSQYVSPDCPSQTLLKGGGTFSMDLYYAPEKEETLKTAIMITYEGANDATYVLTLPLFGNAIAKEQPEQPQTGTHEYVDLGLSVKWATCNVGASSPEDYGWYFAWGETKPKELYGLSTYKWCNGSSKTMTKYCIDSSYGTVDNKTTLELADDAARANWGGSWRMPTRAEQDELREKCTWTWTSQNEKKGYKVTSKINGNSIFLPAAGYRSGDGLFLAGSDGHYWSSSLGASNSGNAFNLYFYSTSFVGWDYGCYRDYGYPVRAVYDADFQPFLTPSVYDYSVEVSGGEVPLKFESNVSCTCRAKEDWITFSSSNPTIMIVAPNPTSAQRTNKIVIENEQYGLKETITVVQAAAEAPTVDHEYVDLGLSVKWATCNVGANSPEEYGDYFAWGETKPKEVYDWSTYKWCNGSSNTMTKYCIDSNYGTVDNNTTLELADDAARANWGGSWRMPTRAEQDELREKCTWTWTSQNEKKGYKVTSKINGNSIFLPAAGYRFGSSLGNAGSDGYYWSSSLSESRSSSACWLDFYSGNVDWSGRSRYGGLSVRAVCP